LAIIQTAVSCGASVTPTDASCNPVFKQKTDAAHDLGGIGFFVSNIAVDWPEYPGGGWLRLREALAG